MQNIFIGTLHLQSTELPKIHFKLAKSRCFTINKLQKHQFYIIDTPSTETG